MNSRSPVSHLPLVQLALVGDHDPAVLAHRAIPLALARTARELALDVRWEWRHTAALGTGVEDALAWFDGIWCVPASPYADTGAALAAIRFAREHAIPFLGTCGGFQHAVLEYARDTLGIGDAAHAELDRGAPDPLIAPLACALVEERGRIVLTPGSRLADACGAEETEEEYHCRYGVSAGWEARVLAGPLRATGRDASGEVRAVELDGHPFFVATLFQPERAALADRTPPIVRAFVAAASVRRPARVS
jgi:CTP synthase (UTP-ammonia lyase)